RPRTTAAAAGTPFLRSAIVSAFVQLACSTACWAFIPSSMPVVKLPGDLPDTIPVMMPATASKARARWCAVTPTVHFSASVIFFQSASLSFSSTDAASWAFASNCFASTSLFAPIGILLDRLVGHARTRQGGRERAGRAERERDRHRPEADGGR